MDPVMDHFGQWWAVALFIILFGIFIAFIPFYKKSYIKPAGTYIAFVIAYALEMFGIPMSMYMISWVLGGTLPDGILWGHTLQQYIGLSGMYIGALISLTGVALVVVGWKQIYDNYWKKDSGKGKLVDTGLYAHIRHPQYTGFFLITLGMMFEWVTLTMLIMWPILLAVYYWLAKKEEDDMIKEFGNEYEEYRKKTKMFIPFII
jgi:protein-S-isoprenylcysteine O-methyltransferase Ste14